MILEVRHSISVAKVMHMTLRSMTLQVLLAYYLSDAKLVNGLPVITCVVSGMLVAAVNLCLAGGRYGRACVH